MHQALVRRMKSTSIAMTCSNLASSTRKRAQQDEPAFGRSALLRKAIMSSNLFISCIFFFSCF